MDIDPYRVVERHSHEEAYFVFVLDGLYVSSAVGADAISRGQTLVFNPPGTTHRDRFEARARVMEGRFLTISIASDLFASATSEGIAPHSATALSDANAIATAARIARACAGCSDSSALHAESLAMSLLSAAVCPPRIGARVPPHWLSVAEELLRDACDQDVRIADLAAVAGVHPVHFARVFRHVNQCTPADYLRHRRVERAEVLLRSSARPLSEIAASAVSRTRATSRIAFVARGG